MTPMTPQGPILDKRAYMQDQPNIDFICLQIARPLPAKERNVTSPSGSSRISLGHGWEEVWVLNPFSIPFGHFGLAFLVYSVLVEGPTTVSDELLVTVECHDCREAEQTCARQTREALLPLVAPPQPSAAAWSAS